MTKVVRDTRGQATVELAVLMPIIIVVGLILINAGFYLETVAHFDRVSQDMVLAHGVSPEQEQSAEHAVQEVRDAIKRSLKNDQIDVDVCTEKVDFWNGSTFSINPARIKFVCTMKYKPVPATATIAGVSLGTPFELSHTKEIVVDAGAIGF